MPRNLRIGDKVGTFYTVGEFCAQLGISISYLDKLEDREIFPQANFRYKSNPNWKKAGLKIYSTILTEKLKPIVSEFKQGVKIDTESKRLIALAFQEEKLHFKS